MLSLHMRHIARRQRRNHSSPRLS